MSIRVGINGFGRTGRAAFRAWWENKRDDFEIVAINRGPVNVRTHLLRYDSDYGRFPAEITDGDDYFTVNNHKVRVFDSNNPSEFPWDDEDVDLVIESTGQFKTADDARVHLGKSVKKVIISAPAKNEDWTVIMGINHDEYSPSEHHVISAGSCTTNCVVLAVKVLHDAFTINHGFMTTVHSYTGDQNLVDNSHKDLRRARAAALNIIPTSSGASKAIGQVIPDLAGKFDGTALRVPTPTVSLVDLTTSLKDSPTIKDVNEVFEAAAESSLAPYLAYEKNELVSTDFKGNLASCIFDAPSTMVVDNHLVKTLEWYDNEWGYSCRLTDVISLIAERGLE